MFELGITTVTVEDLNRRRRSRAEFGLVQLYCEEEVYIMAPSQSVLVTNCYFVKGDRIHIVFLLNV